MCLKYRDANQHGCRLPRLCTRGSRCLSEEKPAAGRPGAFGRAQPQEGTYLGRGWKRGNQPRHHASFREVSRLLCEPPEHLPTDPSVHLSVQQT